MATFLCEWGKGEILESAARKNAADQAPLAALERRYRYIEFGLAQLAPAVENSRRSPSGIV